MVDSGVTNSDAPGQRQNEHNDQNDAEKSRRTVAPAAAVGPARNRADHEQDQNNQQDSAKHGRPHGFARALGRGVAMRTSQGNRSSGYNATKGWSFTCCLKPSNTSFTCGQLLSFFTLLSQRTTFG